MRKLLSKSTFIAWIKCHHTAWYRVNNRRLYEKYVTPEAQELMRVGNEIDHLARDLYPGGLLLGRGKHKETLAAIERRQPVIFQGEFSTGDLIALTDILVWNESAGAYDIIEVKSSTTSTHDRDEEYALDLAFQKFVLTSVGVPVGKTYLMRLNAEYVRQGALDLESLLVPVDFPLSVPVHFGPQAETAEEALPSLMIRAISWINTKIPPEGPCGCTRLTKNNRCEMFAYFNPGIPEYSIYDIARISAVRLQSLVDDGITDITSVPDNFPLSERQARQVHVAKTGKPYIDHKAIRHFLAGVRFPAAFLDFETHNPAVPRFDGYRPYQQIPFQFSLDVARGWDVDLDHHEFLHLERSEPDPLFMEALLAALPKTGSVVVWNKGFEWGRLQEIALRHPMYQAAIQEIGTRFVDLADVFALQLYVDPRFKGSYSIKKVLPVLVPDLSYDTLHVQEGAQAQREWDKIVKGEYGPVGAKEVAEALLKYCALDTRAMVEIARRLAILA